MELNSDRSESTRLWLTSPHFYPTYGGAQNRYRGYIPGFIGRGLDVRVLTGTPMLKERNELDAALDWYDASPGTFLPATSLDGAPLERVRLPDGKGPRRISIYYDALLKVCSRPSEGPVVVQLLTNMRPEARPWIERLRESGVATLYSVSQYPTWPSKWRKRWFRGAGYRNVYNAFDALVTNSPKLEEFLRGIGVTTRIEYIPNGVDVSRFHPVITESDRAARRKKRTELNIPDDHLVIATVGAIMPRKGPDLAIEAWSRLLGKHPNTHLLLVGPRSDQHDSKLAGFGERIQELVDGSGARGQVHFTGQVDDVEDWLRVADLFLIATEREGTPNSVLEALATGLPSVVTRHVGLSEAIGKPGEHYQLVERDVDALTACLDQLLSHPEDHRRWSEAGLANDLADMDQPRSLDRYVDLYTRLAREALLQRA